MDAKRKSFVRLLGLGLLTLAFLLMPQGAGKVFANDVAFDLGFTPLAGSGLQLPHTTCTQCHGLNSRLNFGSITVFPTNTPRPMQVFTAPLTDSEWRTVIEYMRTPGPNGKDATISDTERDTIAAYLGTTKPKSTCTPATLGSCPDTFLVTFVNSTVDATLQSNLEFASLNSEIIQEFSETVTAGSRIRLKNKVSGATINPGDFVEVLDTVTIVNSKGTEFAPNAIDDNVSFDEGDLATLVLDVIDNDLNTNGDKLVFFNTPIVISTLSDTTKGTLALTTSGPKAGITVEFTPDSSFTAGNVTFTYTVTNAIGNDTATVTITVAPTLPIASDDTANVDEGSSVLIDVLFNDIAGVTPDDVTNIIILSVPPHGTAMRVPGTPNQIRYIPNPGFPDPAQASQTDTFEYKATSNGGADVSLLAATVTVTVKTVLVVAIDDPLNNVDVGGSVDISVTANDQGGTPNVVNIVTGPANGTLSVVGLVVTYTPDITFIGPEDTFFYSVTNGAGTSNTAKVTVQVGFASIIGQNAIRNITDDPALLPVAGSLDDVCVDLAAAGPLTPDQSDLLTTCVLLSLTAIGGTKVDQALTAANNRHAFAASETATRIMQTGINNINQRLGHIRSGGGRGFDVAGLRAGYNDYTIPLVMIASIAENAFDLYFPTPEDMRSVPWGFFINGGFSLGDQTATTFEPGFDFDSRGVTMGGDYIFSERFALGAAFTFSNTAVGQIDGAGEIGINGRSVSLYGFMSPAKNFFIEWQAGYGTSNYDSKRNIKFTAPGLAIDRQAIASYDGYQVSALVSGVYDLRFGGLTISPNVEATYIKGTVNPYSESRAGGFNLAVNEQNYSSLNAAGGMRIRYSFKTPFGTIAPRVLFKFNHEFLDDVRAISQNFVSAPTGTSLFEIRSDVPDTDFYTLGGGVEATFGDNFSGFVDYSTLKDLDEVSNHSFTAGIRIRF